MMAGAGHLLRPEKAQETGFWVVVITRTLKTKQSMINYSIVMRNVNANLLEISQVKVLWRLPSTSQCSKAVVSLTRILSVSSFLTMLSVSLKAQSAPFVGVAQWQMCFGDTFHGSRGLPASLRCKGARSG